VAATDVRWPAGTQAGSQKLTEEDTMYQHPTIAKALAEQRRATLVAEAESARLARAARNGHTWPARWFAPRRHPSVPAARSRLARLRPARAR
jgi:hypothetical protein